MKAKIQWAYIEGLEGCTLRLNGIVIAKITALIKTYSISMMDSKLYPAQTTIEVAKKFVEAKFKLKDIKDKTYEDEYSVHNS